MSRSQSAPRQTAASSVCGTKRCERWERFALLSSLTSCSTNVFTGNVGYRWVALERCAEMVRADIAALRWGSVFKECSGPKGHRGQRCTHWCNGEGRRQTVEENNPCSSLLKRSPSCVLAALGLDEVWVFQWDGPSDTAVSVMGKETLWDVVTFLNEPSCMCFHLREHRKTI